MTTADFQLILDNRKPLADLWSATLSDLQAAEGPNGVRFDFTKVIPGIDRSLAELDSRVVGLLDLVVSIENIQDFLLVPSSYMNGLQNALIQILERTKELNNNLLAVPSNGGFGNIDPDTFVFESENGSVNMNVRESFATQVNEFVDDALENYYLLSMIVGGEGYDNFSSAFREFSKTLEATREAEKELNALEIKGRSC